ncbi:MAG: ATP-binding protein [Clostridia bacterium]|nr:ATP-binding protein [Clostridia bacterium]
MDNTTDIRKIPKRILGSLLNSCSAGVVPRNGLEYIAIGRNAEVAAILRDLENIKDGMGAFRFLIGRYGSGKSFLIGLIRTNALERGYVTSDCDLSPDRRFVGRSGQGLAVYRELMRNLSTKASPDHSALESIFTKWFSDLQLEQMKSLGISPDSPELMRAVSEKIFDVCAQLRSYVNGFEFTKVISLLYEAHKSNDEELKADALKWMRGEFTTKSEARHSRINVSSIVDDTNWYDYIKLYAILFRLIGYNGFVVFIDECVNLYKIPNRISRENNYEKILSMFNDTLQGKAEGLAIILGGTPQFLEDERRGLYSYDALKSRLKEGSFNKEGYRDLLSPVIRINRLSDDELFALVVRVLNLHGQYYNWIPRVTNDNLVSFLQLCYDRIGADSMLTPREVIRDFLNVLNILNQNPELDFDGVVGSGAVTLKPDVEGDDEDDEDDDGFFDITI